MNLWGFPSGAHRYPPLSTSHWENHGKMMDFYGKIRKVSETCRFLKQKGWFFDVMMGRGSKLDDVRKILT